MGGPIVELLFTRVEQLTALSGACLPTRVTPAMGRILSVNCLQRFPLSTLRLQNLKPLIAGELSSRSEELSLKDKQQ